MSRLTAARGMLPQAWRMACCRCCWSGTDLVELPLEMIPKMFSWVQIWAERRPGHGVDVVTLKEILGEPGCMCTRIVLLEDKVSMRL